MKYLSLFPAWVFSFHYKRKAPPLNQIQLPIWRIVGNGKCFEKSLHIFVVVFLHFVLSIYLMQTVELWEWTWSLLPASINSDGMCWAAWPGPSITNHVLDPTNSFLQSLCYSRPDISCHFLKICHFSNETTKQNWTLHLKFRYQTKRTL